MFCRSLFVLFILDIVLSVLLRFTASYYPFDIFKLCFSNYVVLFHFHLCVCVHSVFVTIGIWFLPLLDILQWPRYVAVHREMSKINSYKNRLRIPKAVIRSRTTEITLVNRNRAMRTPQIPVWTHVLRRGRQFLLHESHPVTCHEIGKANGIK